MSSSRGNVREVTTPEGVALPFELAEPAERITAFLIDFLIIHVGVALLLVLGGVAAGSAFGGYALSFALLASFFLRNFYFIGLELRWGGATVGKRKLGLRVVSRDGGPLTAEAVFARNLTRDIEVFLPLAALLAPDQLLPGLPVWGAVVGTVWLLVFAALPLLGRDRLRVGDLVGGTLVVRMPTAKLLGDVAEMAEVEDPAGAKPARRYSFTRDQLDLYGIKELQVLEDLLRRSELQTEREVLEAVEEKIKKKIGWPEEDWETDTWAFLTAFYRAQRGRLEQKMLFGVRQEKKRS